MKFQVYSAAALASLPADKTFDTSLMDGTESPERKEVWVVVENASPYMFQLLDEDETLAAVVWPWAWVVRRRGPASGRRQMKLHGLLNASSATTAGQGVWVELTTIEPIPPTSFIIK